MNAFNKITIILMKADTQTAVKRSIVLARRQLISIRPPLHQIKTKVIRCLDNLRG